MTPMGQTLHGIQMAASKHRFTGRDGGNSMEYVAGVSVHFTGLWDATARHLLNNVAVYLCGSVHHRMLLELSALVELPLTWFRGRMQANFVPPPF